MGRQSRPAEAHAADGRRWSARVAAHALCLGLLLVALRVEKSVALDAWPGSALGWLGFVAQDAGLVLLLLASWLACARLPGRALVVGLTHAAVAVLTVLAHSFLLITGYRLLWDVARYAVEQRRMLGDIFAVGLDAALAVRLLGALLSVALALRLGRGRLFVPRPAVVAGVAAAGLLLLLWPLGSGGWLGHLAGNDVWAFASSAVRQVNPRLATQHLSAPEELYRTPRLASEPAAERPDIILFLLESTGAGVVAPYADVGRTPHLERLSDNGLTVESAYVSVSHTSKALVGILCGMWPRLEMVSRESLEGQLPLRCLPRLLRGLGYRTAFMQSALGRFEDRFGLVDNLGFEDAAYRETLIRPGFRPVGYFGLDERALLEPALGWVGAAEGRPFFLTLLTSNAHHPYETPGVGREQALREPLASYEKAVAAQDQLLGELVAGLERLGRLESTLLIVLGDHGESFRRRGPRQHDAVPYEEVTRVPWVLHWPERWTERRTIGGLRHQFDLMPTLMGLLGLSWEGTLPGRDLFATSGHASVLSSCWYRSVCLAERSGDRKVVYHFGMKPLEVFDLAADPGERNDLAAALDGAEIREIEARLLGAKLSVDGFWRQHPAPASAGGPARPAPDGPAAR